MSLADKGMRFMVSADGKSARWCHPVEIEHYYADWFDHTDTPEKEFIEFLEDLSESPVDSTSEQP